VTGPVQLRRGAQAGRTGPDDGHLLAGADLGRGGDDPAVFPTPVDDGALDVLDGDGGGR
jgi:hypothetical protein